ncbi:MAG TPA: hypothetical protein VKZ18_28035 [Polyangia bacterium]|nr:hypothetical protein [Polyangia bacterium]
MRPTRSLVAFARHARWLGLAIPLPLVWACTSRSLEAPNITPTATLTTNFTQKINNEIDILFMIDDSSSMTSMQQKLLDQLPTFMQVLQNLPTGLPSLHVAVVSQDMGAPSDSQIGCTQFGKAGVFQAAPEGTCTATTLTAGSTFISDVDNMPNFTDPIGTVFQCIALLGDMGCGFEHQLAAIDRALGADGSPAPSQNAGFLRPEAYLGIVMLTNEDDCSAPQNTTIYSLNGGQQNIANPDGPIANYRCNGGPRGAHYCQDPANGNAWLIPPLNPPADAQGTATAPTLDLVNCEDNEQPPMGTGTSALTPVSQFISDIKALKPDPDNQILVAGIIAPATPYTVNWAPESGGQNTKPGELWPEVMHSCGAQGSDDVNPASTQFTTDGSFGDPGVRETEFLTAFPNYVVASICDPSYAASMTAIAQKLGALITPPCISGKIQNDTQGNPMCSVIEHLTDMQGNKMDLAVQSCAENGNASPCWSLAPGGMGCANGVQLTITDTTNANAASESSTIDCSLCLPGSTQPGC